MNVINYLNSYKNLQINPARQKPMEKLNRECFPNKLRRTTILKIYILWYIRNLWLQFENKSLFFTHIISVSPCVTFIPSTEQSKSSLSAVTRFQFISLPLLGDGGGGNVDICNFSHPEYMSAINDNSCAMLVGDVSCRWVNRPCTASPYTGFPHCAWIQFVQFRAVYAAITYFYPKFAICGLNSLLCGRTWAHIV